jgi:hypothetical protein
MPLAHALKSLLSCGPFLYIYKKSTLLSYFFWIVSTFVSSLFGLIDRDEIKNYLILGGATYALNYRHRHTHKHTHSPDVCVRAREGDQDLIFSSFSSLKLTKFIYIHTQRKKQTGVSVCLCVYAHIATQIHALTQTHTYSLFFSCFSHGYPSSKTNSLFSSSGLYV